MASVCRTPKWSRRWLPVLLVLGLACLSTGAAADAETKKIEAPAVLDKEAPENVEDLKAIQKHVKTVLEKVIPCTVGLQVGGASGSGVIVTKDGFILTAGHVSGTPDKDVTVILPDGKKVKGKSLGRNNGIDSGMVKITDDKEKDKEWPFVEMGKSAELKLGQWCIATGHPGGFKPGRSPVVRLGRVLHNHASGVTTDCTLVGGDSGGPLFDMEAKVIGINSRINPAITSNVHVPVDTFRDTWDRLAKGDEWDIPRPPKRQGAYMGVEADPEAKEGCKIKSVHENSPADKAGIKADDVITKFDGKKVESLQDLAGIIGKKKPGDEVEVEVKRGEEMKTLKITLAKRPK